MNRRSHLADQQSRSPKLVAPQSARVFLGEWMICPRASLSIQRGMLCKPSIVTSLCVPGMHAATPPTWLRSRPWLLPSPCALQQLNSLLAPAESVWLIGESYPHVPELSFEEKLECLQMVLPEKITPPDPATGHSLIENRKTKNRTTENRELEMVQLSAANTQEMVDLTNLAFPGFFRIRTCEMGSYFGIRANGELIAMGGERLMLEGYPEISGICTHPAHRGKGVAASLIWQLVRSHRREGLHSWLHVGSANNRAIELYLHMGFQIVRKVMLHRITRKD
jgi:ribosomal protein S18 acetylase RimI-like enzyme